MKKKNVGIYSNSESQKVGIIAKRVNKNWNLATCGIENLCGIYSWKQNLNEMKNKMNYELKKALFTTPCIKNCYF